LLLRENLIVPHDVRVITYDAMVAGALRHFLREGTIDMEQLALYRNHGHYVSAVVHTDRANLGARSEGGGGRPRRSLSAEFLARGSVS
jgi:hypothetical protein